MFSHYWTDLFDFSHRSYISLLEYKVLNFFVNVYRWSWNVMVGDFVTFSCLLEHILVTDCFSFPSQEKPVLQDKSILKYYDLIHYHLHDSDQICWACTFWTSSKSWEDSLQHHQLLHNQAKIPFFVSALARLDFNSKNNLQRIFQLN